MRFEEYLKEYPVIAILRGIVPDEVAEVCDVLYENGVRLLEIPLNSKDAVKSIEIASKHTEGRQLVGAGTVLTPQEVRIVAAAGGRFIISPNTDPAVIRETVALNMISIPGFLTPTEAFTAVAAGADYLKLFPAGNFGVEYIKAIKAVIQKPILAVGGVDALNISEFMEVCAGAGVGGAIYKPGTSIADIARNTVAICSAVKQ